MPLLTQRLSPNDIAKLDRLGRNRAASARVILDAWSSGKPPITLPQPKTESLRTTMHVSPEMAALIEEAHKRTGIKKIDILAAAMRDKLVDGD